MSDSVWEGTRTKAVGVFDGIGRVATTGPGEIKHRTYAWQL